MFTYTDSKTDFNSTAVDEAYYNKRTRDLAVVLVGGSGYIYSGVPEGIWDGLTTYSSAGRFYATRIKPYYGPGRYLGYVAEEFVRDPELVTAGVGTPKGLTYKTDATQTTAADYITLVLPAPSDEQAPLRKHAVVFTVEGGNGSERVYRPTVRSVDEAVESLNEVANALDLTVSVKRVTVHFE